MSRLRIALAKGRLYEPSVERFRLAGAAPAGDAGRRLLIPSSDPGIEFLVVKPADVPVYVESGAADLGVTGTDVLRETGADVLEPLELGFGFCRLVVAAPAETGYPALPGGITARVATKYPRLAQAHFGARGRPVDIMTGERIGRGRAAAQPRPLDRGPGGHREHAQGERAGGAGDDPAVRGGAGGQPRGAEAQARSVSRADGAAGEGGRAQGERGRGYELSAVRPGFPLASRSAISRAARMLDASAFPVPAMSSAVPWSGEVRGKGRPSVTFTARPNAATLIAVIPTS